MAEHWHTNGGAWSLEAGGALAGRKRAWVIGTVALGAFMLLAAGAWACTASQMYGKLWLTGPADANGDCPSYSDYHESQDNQQDEFSTGDVACVQAQDLKYPEVDNFYDVKYAPVTEDTPATDPDDHDMLCHESPLRLENENTTHGLYELNPDAHSSLDGLGGWEDQQTVLDMPGGSYVVCAASVPAARVATGYYDAGPDGFGGHMSITVTE